MEALVTGIFLATVNTKLVDVFVAPVRKKFPYLDLWWVIYVALVSGGTIAWLAGVNLFTAYIDNETLGRALSCVLVGGGSSLIHDVFAKE